MKRLLIGCAVAAAMVMAGVGSASAGQPAVQGCMGESVSIHAHYQQPYGRNFVSAVTPRTPFGGSLGDGIQLLQAGGVPDSAYWNICNG